jgi:hypothetical protein
MSPEQFRKVCIRVYGRRKWQIQIADALGVHQGTIFRMMHREQVPGPYEVALLGIVEHWKRQMEIEKAARKLLPRRFRYNKAALKRAAKAARHVPKTD